MFQSNQKIIRIGSSCGVTLPTKELRRQNITVGDEVEITVRPLRTNETGNDKVLSAAKKILKDYRQDFKNLAKR